MAEPLKHLKQWVIEIEKQLFEELKMLVVLNGMSIRQGCLHGRCKS